MRARRRVGVTMRVDEFVERGETRDAVDGALVRLLWDLGALPVLLSSAIDEPDDYVAAQMLDAAVLSGGGTVGEPPGRDRLEQALLRSSASGGLPILGICRGMQVMVVDAGGTLEPVEGHVGGRHPCSGPWADGRHVNSFHEFAVPANGVPAGFSVMASADDGTVEAILHRRMPQGAIMWHPERDDPVHPQDARIMREVLALDEAASL